MVPSENKYLFNGKELQDEQLGGINLDLYDYHARQYDPALGRFTTVDPHAENYTAWSPYHYAANNPIIVTDPTGMDWYYDEDGNSVHVPDSEGSINGTNLTWMAPEGATVADPTVIVANSKGEVQGVGSQKNKEMSRGEVGGSLQYNELIQGIHEATDTWGEPIAMAMAGEMGGIVIGGAVKGLLALRAASKAAKVTKGGLNLFKWGAPQTGKSTGWKAGDYFLNLPNQGTPKLNWKANYGALRSEMRLGKPIYDSYRTSSGNLIPTKGFLNAERSILQGRGWIYNPSMGAWMPPGL